MTLTPEQSGRLHALIVEALSIMDSVPYVPTTPAASEAPPAQAKRASRIRKLGSPAYDLDAEVYDRLLSTPEPQTARGIAEAIHEDGAAVVRSLRRLQAGGRAKQVGSKRGARYLPLSITGAVVQNARACEPDIDETEDIL